MKKFTLILVTLGFTIMGLNAQSCPTSLSSQTSATEPFFKMDQGSNNCADYPDTITIDGSVFNKLSCNGSNLKYTLVSGPPLSDPDSFTVDFGTGPCTYVNGQLQTLSLENYDIDVKFRAYPNPTMGNPEVTIRTNSAEPFSIAVFDLNGKLVIDENYGSDEKKINTSGLRSGIYIMRIKGETFKQHMKLVVN